MYFDPAWKRAIAANESGGRYDLLGPVTNSGDRAYGKYQVMGNNIGPWTQSALGRSMTPDEFLKDQDAQEKVFEHQFGSNVAKYGNPQDAASVWFSGRPMAKAGNASDVLGTTVPAYVAKFNRNLGSEGVNAIEAAMGNKSPSPSGAAMAFDTTQPPDDGFLGQLARYGGNATNGGYTVADALGNAGVAMMSLDNAKGASALSANLAMTRKTTPKASEYQYDPKSGTFFRTGADGKLETTKNPNFSDEAGKPKLTEKAIQNAGESVEKYGTIAAINKDAADVLDDLHTGKLDLGMFKNWINNGQNMAGISDEKSRAFARYQQFLQKVSNDNLLLNKGVQTEGDAYREMKAIAAGGANYDNEASKEAIKKLITRGQEAVLQRGRSTLDAHVSTYGAEPFKPYLDQADRWKSDYDTINKRMEGYAKPAPAAAPAPGNFRVIKAH